MFGLKFAWWCGMKFFLATVFMMGAIQLSAQHWYSTSAGARLSLMFAIGSHQSSVGVGLNTYLAVPNAQFNAGTTYRFFASNLGGRCHFGEWRHSLGLVIRGGKTSNPVNLDFGAALHQSSAPYSLGYAYLWYLDKVGTSQRSGIWNVGMRRVDISFENDVFGGQAKDRFRTGNLTVSYRDSFQKASFGLQLWTGETRFSKWNKVPSDKMPSGYRDLTALPYGYGNHGNLFVEYKQTMDAHQVAGFRMGVDSEQIRHIFQNRISHDLILLPKGIERNTPHYPRLDQYGKNVFSRKEARKPIPYFQVFFNDGLPY